jgi:uncharacterized membrane-anchored protein YhcB (DUF1043 family)
MRKYLAYSLIIIGWSFHTSSVEAGRTTLNVDGFGRFSIDDVEVDFDRVHSNLRRFEEHASSAVGASGFKNNIAVGAITVFFGEEDDAASRSTSTSSGAIKAAKTFYLETSSQATERKLLVFESTPCEGEEDIKWGISGLGCVDGHSMMACQPYNIKSLCFTKMHSFFQQMKKDNERDDEGEYLTSPLSSSTSTSSSSTSSSSSASQLSPREEIHPLSKMLVSIAPFASTESRLRSMREQLRKDWAPLRHLADAYKQLFDEESLQENLISDLEPFPDIPDMEKATDARDYVFRIGESVNKIEKSLDSLDTLIESAPSQLKEFKELVKKVRKDATKIYNECWHSEQRLFHFLFSQLADEEDFSSSSEQSYSSSEEPQTPIPNLEEMTFNWDAVASVGDELQPKVIFLHIHSRLSFCDMCLYTLEEFVPRLMRKVTSFPPGWQLGGILGSYRTPYNQDMLNRTTGSTPWIGKSPFSIAELEDHRSESGIPSLYITTWK